MLFPVNIDSLGEPTGRKGDEKHHLKQSQNESIPYLPRFLIIHLIKAMEKHG